MKILLINLMLQEKSRLILLKLVAESLPGTDIFPVSAAACWSITLTALKHLPFLQEQQHLK